MDIVSSIKGLTKEQVEERIRLGQVNIMPKTPSRTFGQIIRANLFNKFNGINAALAFIVVLAGSPKNALFVGVIITNTIIGVVQEIRAKAIIEKLSMINAAHCRVVREGKELNISFEDIVLGDIMVLKPGAQILADAVVLMGSEFEVDEAMVTGEGELVLRKQGERLLSGSFIVVGSGYAKVTHVGNDTYSAKLCNEAKKYKKINSELERSINKILGTIMWFLIPIGFLLVTTQILYTRRTWQEAVISSAAGIVGMVPQGLVLLTSITFVAGIIRLSKWNTLVQELPATEVLARVDMLCLDKTGTITEGMLQLIAIEPIGGYNLEDIEEIIAGIAHGFPCTNPTQQAILNRYSEAPALKVIKRIPFSSTRKWSGLEFEGKGSWVLGAPEMILKGKYEEVRQVVEAEACNGRRVLLLAKLFCDSLSEELEEEIEGVAFILMEDAIRNEVPKTLEYFEKEGITLKIISGDNPVTVSAVSKRAGVKNADKYIDGSTLPKNIEELKNIVEENTVFGRITPHQKKLLVQALKANGHVVAMTGDGINDVLALKESDCGIAMASGGDAAKAVSQLVLLDSSFISLPQAVLEGRRIINNLETVSVLYLNKTVSSILLSLIFTLACMPYPYMPIQVTLIGMVAIGIPSFFLALGPNKERVKSGFLKRVMKITITTGTMLSLFSSIVFIPAYNYGLPLNQCRTMAVIAAGGISLVVLVRVAKPMTSLKRILIGSMEAIFLLAFIIPFMRNLFSLALLPASLILISLSFVILALWLLITIIKI